MICWKPNSLSAIRLTSSAWNKAAQVRKYWWFSWAEEAFISYNQPLPADLFCGILWILRKNENNLSIPELCHNPLLFPALKTYKLMWNCDIFVAELLKCNNDNIMTAHHKLNGIQEALMELCVLEVVLRTICTVQHSTGPTCGSAKLLLTSILKSRHVKVRHKRWRTTDLFPSINCTFYSQ